VAERLARDIVSLPMHPFLERPQVQYIADLASEFTSDQGRLIGYGYWGPNLARNLADTDGVELAAIADARRIDAGGRAASSGHPMVDAADLIARDVSRQSSSPRRSTRTTRWPCGISVAGTCYRKTTRGIERKRSRSPARRQARRSPDGRSHLRLYWCRP
jgi:hypothetical protein